MVEEMKKVLNMLKKIPHLKSFMVVFSSHVKTAGFAVLLIVLGK